MATISADEVRIPRRIREAVARHERVVVLNRERPVLALVHPDDLPAPRGRRRGRPVREIAAALAGSPTPDPEFGNDMDAVLDSVLADASLIVLSERYGTDRVLTLDHRHFDVLRTLAGDWFVVVPEHR